MKSGLSLQDERIKLDRTLQELVAAQTKFEAIVKKVPNIAIQGFNSRGEVQIWNPFAEELFEVREKQVLGTVPKGRYFSNQTGVRLSQFVKKILSTNQPRTFIEWSLDTKAGQWKHILSSIFPISIKDRESLVVAISLDITESKVKSEKIKEMSRQIERFSEISAAILAIESEPELFDKISEAVVEISDYSRVLISYFMETAPYREVIGYRGIDRHAIEKVMKIEMPKSKYLSIFEKGIKIGNQSCYVPHTRKEILDKKAVIYGQKAYPIREGFWHKDDNLLIAMKDQKGQLIGIISVDDSKSGLAPTVETVRPLEIFANLISETIQKRRLEARMRESEEKYRDLLGNIMIGIIRADPEGILLEANHAAVKMFGHKRADRFLKHNLSDLFNSLEDTGALMREAEESGTVKNREFLMKTRDDRTFWATLSVKAVKDKKGGIKYIDTALEDITERKRLQEDVRRLSVTDELTGLYNRRYFNMHLPEEIRVGEKWSSSLSLIMVDIDDFKVYNDTYHHLQGDEVLKEIAQVIKQNIRKDKDWASRFGGDEFVIVLPGIDAKKADRVAERIRTSFKDINFRPKGEIIHETASLGIAECRHSEGSSSRRCKGDIRLFDYETIATELVRLADQALYKAKKTGKNAIVIADCSIELSRLAGRRLNIKLTQTERHAGTE